MSTCRVVSFTGVDNTVRYFTGVDPKRWGVAEGGEEGGELHR